MAPLQMKDKLHIGKDKDDVGTATYNKAHGAETGKASLASLRAHSMKAHCSLKFLRQI